MPLYEYECQQCRKRTEKRQKFSDPEITQCPFCGGELQRVLSAPAFSFSGGGWYKDLYSSAKSPAANNPGEAAAPKSDAKPSDAGSSAAANAPAPSAPAAASPSPSPASEKK